MFKFYTTKRALIDILIIKEQVSRLFGNDANYKPLLDFIFEKDYLNDNDIPFPTIKHLSKELNIKTAKLTKLIKELYDKLLECNLIFDKVEVIFFLKYFGNYSQVVCDSLKYLPKVGEQVDFGFVTAKVGTSMYYVDKVEHTFENDTQRVYISLRPGIYNVYLKYRRDKALVEREISFKDYYGFDDYQLKDELGIGY